MSVRFENSRLRVSRAYAHVEAFVSEWRELFAQTPPSTTIRKDQAAEWYVASAELSTEVRERIMANKLSIELGEMAYQLRAALDGLIWETVTLCQGTEPSANANRLEFPIASDEATFKKSGINQVDFPQELLRWMHSIQPYSAEKPERDVDSGLSNALREIHDLARLDRHRRLRVVGAIPMEWRIDLEVFPPHYELTDFERIDCDLFSGKYEFLRMRIVSAIPNDPLRYTRLKASTVFEISVEGVYPPQGQTVADHLVWYVRAVTHIIDKFALEMSKH